MPMLAADDGERILVSPMKSWPATRTCPEVAVRGPAMTINSDVCPSRWGPPRPPIRPAHLDTDAA